MIDCQGTHLKASGQFQRLPPCYFLNVNMVWQERHYRAERGDDPRGLWRSDNGQRFDTSSVRDHEENTWQTGDVVRVQVAQCDSADLLESPIGVFPGDLRAFTAVA